MIIYLKELAKTAKSNTKITSGNIQMLKMILLTLRCLSCNRNYKKKKKKIDNDLKKALAITYIFYKDDINKYILML